MSVVQAEDISVREVERRFHLQQTDQSDFFNEWQQHTASPSEIEQYQLERLKQNFDNLSECKTFSEELVKMVVLSPLLDMAGFYQAPFELKTEDSIEITSVNEGRTLKGKIDALVAEERFWALVLESKDTRYDVLTALPQALVYMMSAPDKLQPVYGLLVNGRQFVFVKLLHQPNASNPEYSRSFALSIERSGELAQVLEVLKYIRQTVLEFE